MVYNRVKTGLTEYIERGISMAHNDWLPTRREEQLSMAKKWFEVLIGSGIPPKWGITDMQIAALGQIIQNIDSAEM